MLAGGFQRHCEILPREALTLIVGGSPCQDVLPMGPGRGRTGLCVERSIHFFVFPVLAWAVFRARPDLTVHVVVENAGSIRQEHLSAMSEALGGGACADSGRDWMGEHAAEADLPLHACPGG